MRVVTELSRTTRCIKGALRGSDGRGRKDHGVHEVVNVHPVAKHARVTDGKEPDPLVHLFPVLENGTDLLWVCVRARVVGTDGRKRVWRAM